MAQEFYPTGVMPACLLPLQAEGEIHYPALVSHLASLSGIPGVTGIVVNGHASEVHACSGDERRKIADLALESIGDVTPVICGIYAESNAEAVRSAKEAAASGAHALLLFPPNSLIFGGNARSEMAMSFVADVANATDLPIILFQFPSWTNLQYDFDTLTTLCETIDRIVAIKDLCSDPRLHERQINALHSLARPVNVLTTHSMWLAASLTMGARGVISGAGSVIADRQVALADAIASSDASVGRLVREMHVLVEALYGNPYVNWQARMKDILHRFGMIPSAHIRAPLAPITAQDRARMDQLLGQVSFDANTIYKQYSNKAAA